MDATWITLKTFQQNLTIKQSQIVGWAEDDTLPTNMRGLNICTESGKSITLYFQTSAERKTAVELLQQKLNVPVEVSA